MEQSLTDEQRAAIDAAREAAAANEFEAFAQLQEDLNADIEAGTFQPSERYTREVERLAEEIEAAEVKHGVGSRGELGHLPVPTIEAER